MELLKNSLKSISERMSKRRGPKTPALMAHVVIGYPSLQESIDIARTLASAGAQILELQIPFSDPVADGPTIMRANEAALASGIKTKDCLKAMEVLSKDLDIPLVFMSYLNPLLNYNTGRKKTGLPAFFRDASASGAQGIIVPDIPPEEASDEYWTMAPEYELVPIPIVSPVSNDSRLKKIKAVTLPEAFIYCMSTTGTTGARNVIASGIEFYLRRVRKHFSQPLAVGFGISTREQIQRVGRLAEIAVVGSAVIDLISKTEKSKRLREVEKFLLTLCRESN